MSVCLYCGLSRCKREEIRCAVWKEREEEVVTIALPA
jgi:hypothetical protein